MVGVILGVALCIPAVARAADGSPDAPAAIDAPAAAVWVDAATRTLHVTGVAVIQRDNPLAIPQAYRDAENQARMDAVTRLTQYVYGIEIAAGRIGALVEQDPGKKMIVDSYIQGATLLGKRYLPNGRLEVDVELNLTGLDTILAP